MNNKTLCNDERRSFNRTTKLKLIARPLVRYCLVHSIRLQELNECLKAVFVEEAKILLDISQLPQTSSRINVMTGIHRADIARLEKGGEAPSTAFSHITRIIGAWLYDQEFSSEPGTPRPLQITGKSSEFAALVRKVSLDLNPYTVLFELERSNIVLRKDNTLTLKMEVYVPKDNDAAGYLMLARDMEDLLIAVEENLSLSKKLPNLHIQTEYDKIPPRYVPRINKWILKQGEKFHEKLRKYLSNYDRDINPSLKASEGYTRISVATFSRTDSGRKPSPPFK